MADIGSGVKKGLGKIVQKEECVIVNEYKKKLHGLFIKKTPLFELIETPDTDALL